MHHANTNNLLNRNQYGFTPQTGTIDAALAIKDFVEGILKAGRIAVLVNLDVRGAFDAAWVPAILNTLKELNCPQKPVQPLQMLFPPENRKRLNKRAHGSESKQGLPAGLLLCPRILEPLIQLTARSCYTTSTKAVAFADDLLLAIRGEIVSEAANIANIELGKISTWAKNNKMSFNEQKSTAMLVSRRKRKEQKEIKIYLNYKPLEQANKMKYLGIILDNKFKFTDHVNYAAETCTKLIHSLAISVKISWGLTHETLKIIHKVAVLSLLLYGVPVWREAMTKEFNELKYIRVQRLINIRIEKAYRTTSSEALCILTGLTPVTIKITKAAHLYDIINGRQTWNYRIDS